MPSNSPDNIPPQLALERVLAAEAAEILAAREKGRILHGTTDIDAAGDEVEIAVRRILRGKLGQHYYVGHGPVIDADWNVSPQFDVIIADATVIPALFKSENGTEYFPYEMVYAVGEIKSTFIKGKKPIDSFRDSLKKLQKLKREEVPHNYIRAHTGGITIGAPIQVDRTGPQNELLTFMVFASGGDIIAQDLVSTFDQEDYLQPPNLVCLLDKGIISYLQMEKVGDKLVPTYHINCKRVVPKEGRSFCWALNRCDSPKALAYNWGVFYGLLAQFIMDTTLKPVFPIKYLQRLADKPMHDLISRDQARS